MISDQTTAMERDNIFDNSERRKMMNVRESKSDRDIIPSIIC